MIAPGGLRGGNRGCYRGVTSGLRDAGWRTSRAHARAGRRGSRGAGARRSPPACAVRGWRSMSPTTGARRCSAPRSTSYDVIVLDRDLPGVHGDQVCERLVELECRARVLMLTASAGIEDRVNGLALGADDYLPKPFAFAELVARIRALARRAHPALPPVLSRGDLRVDPAPARRTPRRPAARAERQGARRARAAARGTGCRRVARGAARARLGRGGRPVQQRRQGDGQPLAPQARRAARDRDRAHAGYRI